MSNLRRWDALTREEIGALAPDALLVVPVGSTEQHGPHLATGTDALIATAIAERAAEAARAPETILLAPTLAYGASDHHLPFGGTLSLRVSTFQLVLRDLLASAAGAGVRRVFVLNGETTIWRSRPRKAIIEGQPTSSRPSRQHGRSIR